MHNGTRVVVTGMGVVAPNGYGLAEFERSLRGMRSGIRLVETLGDLGFACRIGGIPQGMGEVARSRFSENDLRGMNESMTYAAIAGMDCWLDAGLEPVIADAAEPDWDTGAIVGTGIGGVDTLAEVVIPRVREHDVRRIGSTAVQRVMASGVSARLAGCLGLGGQVTTNSSACTTGTEAVVSAWFHLRAGRARRMLAGGAEGSSPYTWAGFDAMKVLSRGFNEAPDRGSRPLSATAAGFVPSSGAGFLMLETLESALERGARIHAEVLGGEVNCGGQRGGGSMTAPNPEGVVRCIRTAIGRAGIDPREIDLLNGHLTATMADPIEVDNWRRALERGPGDFPRIQSTKSLIGHALGAAGGIECVASVLQLARGFVHGTANCEDLHPALAAYEGSVSLRSLDSAPRVVAKASFGFGDVNGCVIFRKWE